jgi:adenylosuccinate synthase
MKEVVRAHVEEKNKLLAHVLESDTQVDFESVWTKLEQETAILAPFIGNGSKVLYEALRRRENVIFEGAQGVLLDQMHGTYPYVTSSSTIAGAALTGAGLGPREIDAVLGVAKAYCTRVGEGPFPSEMDESVGEEIRNRGKEFGTITGRPRRCGWFDALAMKRAVRVSGIDSVILTKLDVLTGLRKIKVCTGYELDGEVLDDVPALIEDYARMKPCYVELAGWSEDISSIRRWGELPATVRDFVGEVSRLIECPVSFVSVAPGREATIVVDVPDTLKPFVSLPGVAGN